TLHLPDDQHRVDRSTDVMPDPYFGHADLTRLYVDVDLHHRSRVGVGRTRANPGALVRSGELGGRIAAVTGDNSVPRLGQLHRLRKAHPVAGPLAPVDAAVPRHQLINLTIQRFRRDVEQSLPHLLGGTLGCVAGHEGYARRIASQVDRR